MKNKSDYTKKLAWELMSWRAEEGFNAVDHAIYESQLFRDRRLCRQKMLSFIDLALAWRSAPFAAVKLEEVVDKDKIKALYKSGEQTIPGVKEIRLSKF